ncbi:hypothetical protein CspeluHIS016_0701650 [Cutaneotrichosporon spelunceum]|uniref:Calcium-dependent phosphotriesterase n=1 Tax=Cutaneotrichosporon spelunceum TaxID=1672016 RepID=A0AAD3YDF5_9TREE|nr:hypothetical protein CspeluHIS016_0701650 [Cutaneotrichosporon spelunceum]
MPPLLVLFPPLFILYPVSYVLMLYRTLFPLRPAGTRVRVGGKLVKGYLVGTADEATEDATNLERLGDNNLPFCEDVVVWKSIAIFSSDPTRDVYNPFAAEGDPTKAKNGRLVALHLNEHGATAYDIVHDFTGELHPLGVGVHRTQPLLAVANLAATPSVEVFRLTIVNSKLRAEHLHTLTHPSLTTPNAVVPLSEDSVLVTNSFRFPAKSSKLLNTLEIFLAIPGGSVLCLSAKDKTVCDKVARGIALANGLAISEDGSVLAVAGCFTSNIHIYDVYPPLLSDGHDLSMAGRLRFRESIPAGFMVDNLRFVLTDTHHIFLACGHPSGLDFTACAKSHGTYLSGTRAVSVRVPKQGKRSWWNALFTRVDDRVTILFEDDGRMLGSGATACSTDNGSDIIVTGLFDRRGPIRSGNIDL